MTQQEYDARVARIGHVLNALDLACNLAPCHRFISDHHGCEGCPIAAARDAVMKDCFHYLEDEEKETAQ